MGKTSPRKKEKNGKALGTKTPAKNAASKHVAAVGAFSPKDEVPAAKSTTAVSASSPKDEVLAARAQKGDRQAEEALIARYKQAVRYRAGTYFILGADRDDVVQEGMIGLFKAVRSYDAEKGASFSTYAGVCIERQILDAVKAASRKKHEPLNSSLSVEEEEGALWLSRLSGEEESPSWGAEDLLGHVYGDWKGEFSRMELEVLHRRLEGEDAKTIAAALGKEPKAVYNAVERLKKKIRSLAEERGLFH